MKVYVETYGCSANQSHTEAMTGLLVESGHEIVGESDADVIVVNTCVVKGQTENKIRDRLKQLKNKKVVVAGCMADTQPELIREILPNASIVGNGRVVFNIKGNKYRLIVKFEFKMHALFIRFLGTHKEYDRINASEV